MDVVLYSTGCPKCRVLEKKLDEAGISYRINNSTEEMISLGITQVPVLSVSGELLRFANAVQWINHKSMIGG